MFRKQFCICRCFLERNIYIKDYDIHINYVNTSQFSMDYREVFKAKGCDDLHVIEEEVNKEISRRKRLLAELKERRKLVKDTYQPIHPTIYKFSESFLHSRFSEIFNSMLNGAVTDETFSKYVKKHSGELFSFPVFNNAFCDKLIEEVKCFERSSLPKERPNTMNKYGVNLDDIGFEEFVSQLRTTFMNPLAKLLFPKWAGSELDSHKAFIVSYKKGEDTDLGYHYDNAEVTLNVSLNDDFSDGALFFGPMRFEDSSTRFGYEHSKGTGVFHRGQQMHGAFPITDGERYNLIIWMRSSEVRNRLCPMCDQLPTLEPVTEGFGDGFTQVTQDICSAS